MLNKNTKHTGHAQLQLDYHYKTADFKKSKGKKSSFEKSQDSRRVLVYPFYRIGYPLVVFQPHNWSNPREYLASDSVFRWGRYYFSLVNRAQTPINTMDEPRAPTAPLATTRAG